MPDDYSVSSGGGAEGDTSGGSSSSSSGGGEITGAGFEYSAPMGGSVEFDTTTQITNGASYNTISCPCSSYAIDLGNGIIGCERDYFGEIQSIKSIPINNHLISNNYPKVGDKWLCANTRCEQGDFKWDTLHVVKVEKNLVGQYSSFLNSKTSTLNCHIPLSTISSSPKNKSFKDIMIDDGVVDFPEPITYIDGQPLYKEEKNARAYFSYYDKESRDLSKILSEYNEDGFSGYLPIKEKLITSVIVNGVDVLDNVLPNFRTLYNRESDSGKMLFKAKGDKINIQINGIYDPKFTLSLKDSSGCEVLKDKHKNVICTGKYSITELIPSLTSGSTKEVYDLKITLAADTKYHIFRSEPMTGVISVKIYQYKDTVNTFVAAASTLAGASTTVPTINVNQTFIGIPNSEGLFEDNFVYTTTISDAGKIFYVKDPMPKFSDLVTKNNIIKKVIIREDTADTSSINQIVVIGKPEHDANDNPIYQGDIKVGMVYDSTITEVETIRKSIDLDVHKEPCDNCEDQDILTNKFEIDDTKHVFAGMSVEGLDYKGRKFFTNLYSVDCNRSITLGNSHIIDKHTNLTFKYRTHGHVLRIDNCKEGELAYLSSKTKLPHNSEITFENANVSEIGGTIKCSQSGVIDEMVVTTTIDRIKYGQEDVTFTLNVDDLITYTPNIRDQYVTIGKNSTTSYIDFQKGIADSNRHADLTFTITEQPRYGTITESAKGETHLYVPNNEFVGKDRITFKFTRNGVDSETATMFITIK